ncbi:uncharacterized protein LOC135120654 [Zophobas morio]|uniref:uncharacterized protein LOC135120654 n=1 Tax=Zophobas morio TaxID=2755281 RepID=UPI003082FED5
MTKDSFVVGVALSGHKFCAGETVLTGLTSPWNTFALWRLSTLAIVGFLNVSEGNVLVDGGVEEVPTISMLQSIYPETTKAKLIKLSDVVWNTNWEDESRSSWHIKKLTSKISRSSAQLKLLKLKNGKVEHIDLSC